MQYRGKIFLKPRFLGVSLTTLLLAGLLAACGNDTTVPTTAATTTAAGTTAAAPVMTPVATTGAAPTTASATTASATTAVATSAAATTAPVTTTAQTSAPATTAAATTASAATTVAVATTAAQTTTGPATTTVSADIKNRPIDNRYPAGPAPTAAPPSGGLVDAPLQVPDALKKGVFAQARTMQLPQGFSISLYSQLSGTPRHGVFSPDGRLFVSERGAGQVVVLKDNGQYGEPSVFASGMNGPHGLAFHTANGQLYLYVAENDKVTRIPYTDGQATADKKEVIVSDLPTGGNHTTRSIAFGPDNKMYIAAGSTCNVCVETNPMRAAITQYNDDGTGKRIFATGLRNEVGIEFSPVTGEVWGVENSRDNLGNNIPPEEINIIVDGGNYGWPYCYSNKVVDTNFGGKDQAYCDGTLPPALPMQAHSAPLGLDFYLPKTMQFPADFQGDVFVAFHGSWNSSVPTGYKVVRVRVKDGRPDSYEDFATGWQTSGGYWGRPVDPVVGPDGSLYVTDDDANAVYKITYTK